MNVSKLCDLYGALLTPKRLDAVRSYYDYDLSLAEIAQNCGITRQAARSAISAGVSELHNYEQVLHMSELIKNLQTSLDCAYDALTAEDCKSALSAVEAARTYLGTE